MARLKAAVIAYLQPFLEERRPSSDWSADDWTWIVANPEPFCRVEGSEYVRRLSVVDIVVLSISPVRIQITVSEGASRGVSVIA